MSTAASGSAICATMPHSSGEATRPRCHQHGDAQRWWRRGSPNPRIPPRADLGWWRHSPKPRGCPPILTIRQSSPLELVSSRSLGNLQRGELSMADPQCWAGAPGDGTYRFWVSASITMEM